jgi:arsenate reductase
MPLQNLKELIKQLEKRFDEIPKERKELISLFAAYISENVKDEKVINLNFICTHNSRRSHMAQIWAQTAAKNSGIPNVNCFSGGTEVTAFNPRAVKAIRDFGFRVSQKDESENPVYLVYYSDEKEPLQCFSKVYSDEFNPQNNFAAIMTCSHADENCPVVFGAESRFPIRYDDPKEFDGTELEEEKYKERFEQIGIEMLFVFNNI